VNTKILILNTVVAIIELKINIIINNTLKAKLVFIKIHKTCEIWRNWIDERIEYHGTSKLIRDNMRVGESISFVIEQLETYDLKVKLS